MPCILVIDDELAITELLEAVLAYEGYTVILASNGKEGLEQLARQPFDLILCDIMMPVMDGREFCRTAREDARYQHIPLVLMSAVREFLVGGDCSYTAFITKPFDIDAILATIEDLIGPPPDPALT